MADDNIIHFADETDTAPVVKKVPVSTSELQGRAGTTQTGAVCDGGTMLSPDSHNAQDVLSLEHKGPDTGHSSSDDSYLMTMGNTQDALRQQSAAQKHKGPDTGHSSSDDSYLMTMGNTQDALRQQSAAQKHKGPDTGHSSPDDSYLMTMANTQDALRQQSAAQKHKGTDTGHSSSDDSYLMTKGNTQNALQQQSAAQKHKGPDTGHSSSDDSYLMTMGNTQDALRQQSAAQKHKGPDTGHSSPDDSYLMTMANTQDALRQQSAAQKHKGTDTGHSSSDDSYLMTKGNTQDALQQQSAAQKHKGPDTGHSSSHDSYLMTMGNTQDALRQQSAAQKHKGTDTGHSSSDDSYLMTTGNTQDALRQQSAAQKHKGPDTGHSSPDDSYLMTMGNTQDALRQQSAAQKHKGPDTGHSSPDDSYLMTMGNTQDALRQQSAAQKHKGPDTGHSSPDDSYLMTMGNTQDALRQQSAAQKHKGPDTGHSSSDDSYLMTMGNTQDALRQQSAAQKHKGPDTGHSSSDDSYLMTTGNTQDALRQQSAAQKHKGPDTGHSSSVDSYLMTTGNTQDALRQQSAAQMHKGPDTGHSSSDDSYLMTMGNTQDALRQQSAAQKHKGPDTGHSSSVDSYLMTRGNRQGALQQQNATQEHTRAGTSHASSISYRMTTGNTQFTAQEHAILAVRQPSDQPVVSQQENTKQAYENLAHLKNKDHCWEEKNIVRDSGVDQVQMPIHPLVASLISVSEANILMVLDALMKEKCHIGEGWLSENMLTVQGTKENVKNALCKVIYQCEIDGEDFRDDMKRCLQSLQVRLFDRMRFTEMKGKFGIFAINEREVTKEILYALKQVRNKTVHVPLPVYAYAFLALKLGDVKKSASVHDPSLDVTISENSPEVILCTERHSVSSTVEWFHNVVVRLNTAVKKVKYPHALYLQSVKAHNTLKKMEADTGCRIDVMVDGEQPVVTATSSNGHQLLVCHGPIAATDCKLIVLPLHAEQKLWSPSEKFVLRRSLLSEDLEMYHRFCTDRLELHCHGDYADRMVVVVPIPAYSEGKKKEQRRIMEIYKTVFTSLKDGQHSVAIFLKEWKMKTQKFMKYVLEAVFDALSNLGSKSCVTVVVYTDSIENAQNFCHIMQTGLPADWRQEPKTQKDQQGNVFERRLIVQDGEIQKVEADVVVNSTNVLLELKHGSVEKAILEAAGEELNKHLKKLRIELQPIYMHDVVATDSFNMKNAKKIFHVAIEPFSDEKKDTLHHGLYVVTQRCLLKASMENHKSIAFPLLGTGKFKYPANDVKNTMTSAIKKFFTEMPHSSLEKVILVCFRQKGQEGMMSWLGWNATKHIEERIDCTNPSKTSEKEYSVAVCGPCGVDQCLEAVMEQVVCSTPQWYMKMAPEIHELEEKRQGPVYHAEKGMNGKNSREINELQVDALKFLMKDEFDQAFEVKMNKGACTITLKKTSSADLLRKVDSLREDYVPLSAEEIARLEDIIDVSQDGIEAFIKTVRDQCKVAIFAFDFYAISSAKHHVKVKVGQVKVTTRAHRQFGSGESGVGRSVSLKAFNPPNPADFFTKSGIKVSVYRANITKLSIEAIVNAANGSLLNGGGVAGAIAGAAGPAMDMECKDYIRKHGIMKVSDVAVTTGGQLGCKKVLHAVGPCWFDYTDKNMCKHHLSSTVFNCLCTANDLKFSAIALPSISSAIFGVPQEICAESYLAAVLKFDDHIVKKKLKHIHFVDVNDEMVVRIQNVFTAECSSNGSKLRAGQGHLPGPGGVSGTEGTRPHTPWGRHMQVTAPQSTDSLV